MRFRATSRGLLVVLLLVPPLAAQEYAVTISNEADRDEFVLALGPLDLPASLVAGHGHDGTISPPVGTVRIPIDAFLHGFSWELVDGDGRVLPQNILHHVNLVDPDYRELFLPIARRMLAAGSETPPASLPWFFFGYPVSQGQRVVVSVTLHNPTGEDLEDVSVRLHLKYVKAGRPWPLFDILPFHIDVAFPDNNRSLDLPPGASAWSWEGSPAIAGRIMGIGSHLHEYAESISLTDVTTGKLVWEGKPTLNDEGKLDRAPVGRLYRTFGVKVYPDHIYRATVTYSNPTADTLMAGGMGVVAGVFLPSDTDAWPPADTSDSLYVSDLLHYMQADRDSTQTPPSTIHDRGHN